MFQSINPFTEELFGETSSLSHSQIEEKLSFSTQAFGKWNQMSVETRVSYVSHLMALLEEEKKNLATLITKEMGKPITQSVAEIEKCQLLCEYISKQAPVFLADQKNIPSASSESYVIYKPLGAILGIMPWNFPFWQVFRFALPTLLSGNVVLVKQAPNVMLCGVELEKLFVRAGFPLGIYQNLPISIEQIEKMIADSRIRGVSLTGSVKAGRAVSALAGRYLKKNVLELGGSDPYIILDSADLEKAARECVLSRLNNGGQSCIAAKRLIVTKKNEKEFLSLLTREMQKYKMDDPMLPDTKLGPLARKDLRDHLHNQVEDLVKKGASILLEAKLPKNKKGYFYPPTILHTVWGSEASAFAEELFGPVALVITIPSEEEALFVSNASPYGLGAAVFSKDEAQAEQWARDKIHAGSCAVNQALHSHPALPFGGIKDSGYGRELSAWGFYEFVNIKTIFR
ncbi:MAG: NAD-dependent succinate-semialdehyde dehydrogenase [Bdellovibrionales bacterium]|nr:NAD-dependent succinate-semialdehyde dehydrogenase [Bdellovibrionales bacterium]